MCRQKIRGAFYRNRFHHIPTDGISCVNRNRVKGAESGVCLFGTNDRVIMRSLRRVASSVFEGVLYGSERPCCRPQCPCMGGEAEGRRIFAACDSSPFTKMSQLQLQPFRAQSQHLLEERSLRKAYKSAMQQQWATSWYLRPKQKKPHFTLAR